MTGLRRRLGSVTSLVFVILAFLPGVLRAQAPIDPSLPSAPIPSAGFFAIFPAYEVVKNPTRPVPPLKPWQKFEIAFHKTAAPTLLVDALWDSSFEQVTNTGPAYGQEWGAFGKRFGYNAANITTKNLFATGIVPAAFHQDPRYFRLGAGSAAKRIRWVLLSQVVAFSDRGTRMANYGNLLGYGASTALSNTYMPARAVSFSNDMKGYGIKFGVSTALDFYYEFDLGRLLHKPGSHRHN